MVVPKLNGPVWATVPLSEEGRARLPEVRQWVEGQSSDRVLSGLTSPTSARRVCRSWDFTFSDPIWLCSALNPAPTHVCYNTLVTWSSPPCVQRSKLRPPQTRTQTPFPSSSSTVVPTLEHLAVTFRAPPLLSFQEAPRLFKAPESPLISLWMLRRPSTLRERRKRGPLGVFLLSFPNEYSH